MSVFLQNQGEHNGINAIPKDIRDDMAKLVLFIQENAAKTVFVDMDEAQTADKIARYLNVYNKEEIEQDAKAEIVDNLTKEDEEKLKDAHAEDYNGLDDDMPDAYEDWLMDLTSDELRTILATQPKENKPLTVIGDQS